MSSIKRQTPVNVNKNRELTKKEKQLKNLTLQLNKDHIKEEDIVRWEESENNKTDRIHDLKAVSVSFLLFSEYLCP